MAIALHSNAEGGSWPRHSTIAHETGYNTQTVTIAITRLSTLTIHDDRVLLVVPQTADRHRFAGNHYLVFPTPDDVEKYTVSPSLYFPSTVDPSSVKSTENSPSLYFPSTVDPYERTSTEKEIQERESSSCDEDDGPPSESCADEPRPGEFTLLQHGVSPKVAREFSAVPSDVLEKFIEKRLHGYPRDEWARHMGSVVLAMRRIGIRRMIDEYERSKNPWAQREATWD
jgi:hypothetical protein